jgi:hypothetical protein
MRRVAATLPLLLGWLAAPALALPQNDAESQYVGDEACARCHPSQAQSFRRTGMARSMAPPAVADPLGEFRQTASVPGLSGVSYRSAVRDGRFYQETLRDNTVLESHEVLYGIGSGRHGRSYVVARGDSLFLAPLSYYAPRAAWDLSPGYSTGAYRDFLRPVTVSCLFCHAGLPPVTGSANHYMQPPFRALAISCERCHGPGEAHVKLPSAGIINPAKLAGGFRDDVCYQCHLGGDIRILKPGRTELDFRPGARLDDVVAIFSVPPSVKPDGLDAVGQAGQLRMSRCSKSSQGRLGCITCHDPHAEPSGPAAAAFYRGRCQQCHEKHPCAAPARRRNATSPPDNCVACHMPKSPLNRIAHIAHTNHRIFRRPEEALDPSLASAAGFDLVYENGRSPQAEADLRSRALAYSEAARGLPAFTGRAFRLLEDALKGDQRNAELTAAYGLVLRGAGADRARQSAEFLERAVEYGSRSGEVRLALCEVLASSGQTERAVPQCRSAIELAPYDPAAYLPLIRLHLRQGDKDDAAALLLQLREFDPANPALPELVRQAREGK